MAATMTERNMAMALRMRALDIHDDVIEDLVGVRLAPVIDDDDDRDNDDDRAETEDEETIAIEA